MSEEKPSMSKKLALFQSTKWGWVHAFEMPETRDDYAYTDYVRISEWQPIEFKPLTSDEVAVAAMQALAKEREKCVAKFTVELRGIDERMANLRALTGPVQS